MSERDIVISALKGTRGGRLRVMVGQRSIATVDALRAHELDLRVGRSLTDAEVRALQAEDQRLRAREAALRLLRVRPRSAQELRTRLLARGFDPGICEETIDRLRNTGLIDDEAFARHLTEQMLRRGGGGRRLLESRLARAGIDPEIRGRILEEMLRDHDPVEDALGLLRTRFGRIVEGAWHEETARRRMIGRARGLLARRGFDTQTSIEALERFLAELGVQIEEGTP